MEHALSPKADKKRLTTDEQECLQPVILLRSGGFRYGCIEFRQRGKSYRTWQGVATGEIITAGINEREYVLKPFLYKSTIEQ